VERSDVLRRADWNFASCITGPQNEKTLKLLQTQIEVPDGFMLDLSAVTKQVELVGRARLSERVTNPAEQSVAVDAARDIRTWVKEVRAAGKTLRDPLNRAAKQVKSIEDEYCAPLEREQERIERLVTDFQDKEARRVAEEERHRAQETARLEAERLEREAAAVWAASDITDEQQLDAAIEAECQAKEAEAKLQKAIAVPLPEVRKAGGVATRKVLRWEVTDLHALYAARPELCKIEPKASAIQATCVPEMPVPGLRLWWENQTSVRTK
jgi:hypothetical protein